MLVPPKMRDNEKEQPFETNMYKEFTKPMKDTKHRFKKLCGLPHPKQGKYKENHIQVKKKKNRK